MKLHTSTLPPAVWRRPFVWGLFFLCLVLIFVGYRSFFSMSDREDGKMPPRSAVPVRIATVHIKDMPRYITALGTVQASGSVLVRSRVDGQLNALYFEEGHIVKAGDILAEIDPRPFANALREAQGQLARDTALLENSRRDLTRYQQLAKGDFIAAQQVETQRALVRQYEGVVRSDEANVASAALQLEYSRITAPMEGRLGLRQVDVGNMIRASDAHGLVRITRTQPSEVVFTLPEAELPAVVAGDSAAKKTGQALRVEAWNRDNTHILSEGTLSSIDNQIDAATGTIKCKALFPNKDGGLFPNQFVNVRLEVTTRLQAVVVSAAAVQLGAQGSYVYVVEADDTVRLCVIRPAWRTDALVVVDEGLQAGQRVVVDGTDRLRDGMVVQYNQPTTSQ